MLVDIFRSSTQDVSSDEIRAGESVSRSVVKAISWRILGTIDTMLIAYFISGQWKLALSIGLIERFSKMILYIVHERIWNRISWGKGARL